MLLRLHSVADQVTPDTPGAGSDTQRLGETMAAVRGPPWGASRSQIGD